MITSTVQRYTERRESRRPAGEPIRTSEFDVDDAASPTVAKAFVVLHHYAGTCGPTAHPFTLHHRGELVGAACFGPPASANAHRKVFPTLTQREAVSLSRFVLVDSVPGNGESWFIARCFEVLRARGIVAIETCADPTRGHVGTIYQATNGTHIGRTNPTKLSVFRDGEVFSDRAASKARCGERGREYAIGQLVRRGAPRPYYDENITEWLRYWRAELTTSVHHPGNYRYLWCLDRRRRREVMRFEPLPYPKLEAA